MSGYEPFNNDVERIGHYVYTGADSQVSSKLANKAQSRLIHNSVRRLPKCFSLIDIGCGDGTYTSEFLSLNIDKIVGIDLSDGGVKSAKLNFEKSKRGLTFYCESLETHAARGERYDVAILRGVIHHAEDPGKLIAEVAKVARYLVVSDPNGLNPILKIIEKTSKYHIEHKERSFLPSTIKKWITNSGFELVETRVGVLVPFFAPNFIAVILNFLQAVVERIPILRWILCGTQIHVAKLK
jgi:2-polyprenyl-3-methyl-5-hydroxy-6-metoxy-1,4-benzoquinol methylase